MNNPGLVMLPQKGRGIVKVPWLCCRKDETLSRTHGYAAGGEVLPRSFDYATWSAGGRCF